MAIRVLAGKRIILGVTGSIACYKAVDLASKLTQAGALVDIILTDAAQQFVTPLTFQAVTGRPVYTTLWAPSPGDGLPTHIAHVGLAEGTDLLMVAPATAHTLAKLAVGLADDLLGVTALAATCPLLVAPAMDGSMYAHAAVQANLATLQSRGAMVIQPEAGRFASGLTGIGRLPETAALMGHIRMALGRVNGVLAGQHVIVTAGGTREAIDPVRFIGNRSSGKQGYALAQAALDAGAHVTLISSAGAGLSVPTGAALVPVTSAADLKAAVLAHAVPGTILIMAAAVADFKPAAQAEHKIKKSSDNAEGFALQLTRTDDILAAVKETRDAGFGPRLVVAFAAESRDLIANADDKLRRKGADLLVANDISARDAGFETDTNRVVILRPGAEPEHMPLLSKSEAAEAVIRRAAALLGE
ncbi:MAG: bifunctional phosphopantothenoylcysteine decarboxylase/phosphopantothenate--cysteine ligase CoaBC [Pleurocapsa minor GSE-CHR-MK-17-07R]|jgi:phosphopantothenoylcysteine decarboxylase/phosphopantothenate--cysteine ligase|nr:bifunctional phosphopantothenoylcysteine decarboxylase/phosphopantothenate--cysteine ligase CoaBC [Pleurocapsa minor GSE-CHR-MK 17-07R]